ncbi:S-layer homology domain-containing protein [Bacillus cereus]|nr:S-layer homology domain-containing protein [Bacillus cereus]
MNFKQIILAGAVITTATLTTLNSVQAEKKIFNDVPVNHWSEKAINDLANRKIVYGYGNNKFGFGDKVTRGQVARMLYNYLKPQDVDTSFQTPFTDIKGNMFEKEILAIVKAGIMIGYGNDKFGPNDMLTREQMAVVLANAFKLKANSITNFKDVDKNYWATKAISALQENKLSAGTGNDMFEPKVIVTREQYSQFLYNAINKVEKPEVKPEVKIEATKETTSEINLPASLDKSLVTNDVTYNQIAVNILQVSQISISEQAQSLVRDINKKYNTNLKFSNIGLGIKLLDEDMHLPTDSIGGQLLVEGPAENDFEIKSLYNNEAVVELTKKWVTLLVPELNLNQEIQEAVDKHTMNNYYLKGDYRVRIMNSESDKVMRVQVEPK